jgi:hypothetical protein
MDAEAGGDARQWAAAVLLGRSCGYYCWREEGLPNRCSLEAAVDLVDSPPAALFCYADVGIDGCRGYKS